MGGKGVGTAALNDEGRTGELRDTARLIHSVARLLGLR